MKHVIKNFDDLATTPLRNDALSILEAGYEAIKTEDVIKSEIKREGSTLFISGRTVDLNSYDRLFFAGIGKCAADAAIVLEDILGDYITEGIIIDIRDVPLKKIKSFVGTHPFPSEKNMAAARSVKEMLEKATKHDLVLVLISGGGSSLLCLPHGITLEALTEITGSLMRQGATIDEVNTVRKHTSDIQGGQFAKLAHPARVVTLIFSDVPGNDISVVASGPTVVDTTTAEDAEKVLTKYNIRTLCKLPDCKIIETPKDPKYFENVENILLITNERALDAMKKKARSLGYDALIVDTKLQGEAREVGARLAREAGTPRTCLLYGGETTVTVETKGKGGRCQEVSLGGLLYLDDHSILVASASDGWDNTDMAGAIADSDLRSRAEALSLDVKDWLKKNQSYGFFNKVGGHIDTGRTGMNVSDLYFTLTDTY